MKRFSSIEFCAGAGGQALGLEQAGFRHLLLLDNDADCCTTLSCNRPSWRVDCADMNEFSVTDIKGVDLFAAGLPCPPFSIAGKQLGEADERDLFPAAFRLIEATEPRMVLIENVRGFLSKTFAPYRESIRQKFDALGFDVAWRMYDAKDFGVSQSRSRVAIIAAQRQIWPHFQFPEPSGSPAICVGDLLSDLMNANGWSGADEWAHNASKIAPTIVGGSKKHGGPDLGPTRARAAWKLMGVNGSSIAEEAPEKGFEGLPRLTNNMVARIQGFPDDWVFTGRKTAAYRQIGNAFPPPVAKAIGLAIREALIKYDLSVSLTDMAAE